MDNGEWIEGGYADIPAPPVCIGEPGKPTACIVAPDSRYMPDWGLPYRMAMYEVDPATVGQYTGRQIAERDATDDSAHLHMKKVWQDDLIAIYSISYDDDDNPVITHVATVQVKWDDDYQILFAKCVKGCMQKIAEECDISYLETDCDIPFTYFLETMENSACQFWEWEIIGNIHDGKDGAKQKEAGTDVHQQDD